MSYIKTQWKTGDTITADKLNNIENGIAELENNGVFLIEFTMTGSSANLNTSYNQLKQAVMSGKKILAATNMDGEYSVIDISVEFSEYSSGKKQVMLYSGAGVNTGVFDVNQGEEDKPLVFNGVA